MVPVALIVVPKIGTAVVEPTPEAGGDAHVAFTSVAELIDVLHVNPVLVVHVSALELVLQLGMEKAVGLALDAVALARTVLAAMAAMPLTPIPPHAGADEPPVETMA